MIFLFGDYGVYNRNASVFSIKSLFDKVGLDSHIITPTIDQKLQRNRAAVNSGFKAGTIWSIYDCFTGRMVQENREYRLEDYQVPDGYLATAGSDSKHYASLEGLALDIKTRIDGTIEAVEFFENGQLVKRENYDDGGYLVTVEYPLGEEDLHTKVVNQRGESIFELYQIGKYKKVVKVKYVPENLDFLSENEFWKWAFEYLVEAKAASDKFFILNEQFRKAIMTAEFRRQNVYLLQTAPFDESASRDILFDHYDKVIFNGTRELKKVQKKFDEKSQAKLYWNNFIPSDKIMADFQIGDFRVYLNLGVESDTIKFIDVLNFIREILDEEPEVHFVIEFSLLRNQVDFLRLLTNSGISEDVVKERITALTRPWPEKVAEEMAKAILYIHYQNDEVISQTLATAIAAERPILALAGDGLLEDYLDDTSNGKLISEGSISRLIRQSIYDVEFIKYLAPDPQAIRRKLDSKATRARWQEIFDDKGIKI